jgi:hypothetical protein
MSATQISAQGTREKSPMMTMPRLYVPITVGVLLLAGGVFHGIWTNRFHNKDALFREHAERVKRLGLVIGEWTGEPIMEDTKIPKEQQDTSIVRGYVNKSDERVFLFLTYGEMGPLCFNHTPLGCYPSNGYQQIGRERTVSIPGLENKAEFHVADFMKPGPTPHNVRVMWAWSGAGDWLVPNSLRIAFAKYFGLYKLYVTRDLVSIDEPFVETDPMVEFARALIPELSKTLFQESKAKTAS